MPLSPDKRDARFDLVRIVAMLMIIMGHFIYHGIRNGAADNITIDRTAGGIINFALSQFLMYCSVIGPNLFMMITGYFLIVPRPINYALKKSVRLWRDIVFYGVGIYFVYLMVAGTDAFEFSSFVRYLTPLYSNVWWFMTVYVAVLLLSPFIASVSNLSRRDYLILLIILLGLNFAQESL